MAATYWIKLYHEILDDPKMATLPDRLWRRVVELFLLAGRLNHGGTLPDARQIAWMLRVSTDDIMADMEQLENTGIIEPIPNGWIVVKFAERQAAVPASERMAALRERRNQEQYYGKDVLQNVTDELRNVTQIRSDTDIDINKNKEDEVSQIFLNFQQLTGTITSKQADDIKDAVSYYSAEWVTEALNIATANNVRNWAYILAILKDWKLNGYKNREGKARLPGKAGNGHKPRTVGELELENMNKERKAQNLPLMTMPEYMAQEMERRERRNAEL